MATVIDRAWSFLGEQPITGDEELDRALLVAGLVELGRTPSDLKSELRTILDPWFQACLEPDEYGEPDLPWEGFDKIYRQWISQEPVVSALQRPAAAA